MQQGELAPAVPLAQEVGQSSSLEVSQSRGDAALRAGVARWDVGGLFQPEWFCDSAISTQGCRLGTTDTSSALLGGKQTFQNLTICFLLQLPALLIIRRRLINPPVAALVTGHLPW